MALKPRYKRRIFWTTLSVIGGAALAVVIVPPMITLNGFRPFLEKTILEQTDVHAKLNGDIHFSLIGGATIVAHDVVVPTARIGAVLLSVPFRDMFDIKNATLDRTVVIYDADIKIDKLAPVAFNHNIEINDSDIDFMGHKFHIVDAEFSDGAFHGIVRTDDHKYDVEFIGDSFYIKNKNDNLDLTGQMYADGTVRGHISLDMDGIKNLFGLPPIKFNRTMDVSANFEWDGGRGYKLTNIISPDFAGNIELNPNGERVIQLVSENMVFDFSFLGQPNKILSKTIFNLDLYGNLRFLNHDFEHLRVQATGTPDKFQIANIIADNVAMTGGYIDATGGHDIMITLPVDGVSAMCMFSGNPDKWKCVEFSYGDMSGSLSVDGDRFDIFVQSNNPMPTREELSNLVAKLGRRGTIKFQFADIGGTFEITPDAVKPSYNFAQNKTLKWLNVDLGWLPEFMMNDAGNFSWTNGMLTFIPHNGAWQLSMYDNYFYLSGNSFKAWLPGVDLQSVNDAGYVATGFYNNGKISNLNIKIAGHEFSGSASGKNITLNTAVLNIDTFMNQAFVDNYAELEFLTNAPILVPFNLPVNIALSADVLIYNGNEYKNFVYALKPESQTFSIMDSDRGNLLAQIDKNKTQYEIFMQLNRFAITGNLLSQDMPLNIRDTMITAEISMNTHGQIAHDIFYNLAGEMDLAFNGGYLDGMSFDEFYASAENITTLNAEYALAAALEGGSTQIKKMRVIGEYKNGNFITTAPIELSMRHTDAIGGLAITDRRMTAEFDLTLRGTAPVPATIQLSILPDGGRQYSLSEIMKDIDPGFMRAFVKNHDKF